MVHHIKYTLYRFNLAGLGFLWLVGEKAIVHWVFIPRKVTDLFLLQSVTAIKARFSSPTPRLTLSTHLYRSGAPTEANTEDQQAPRHFEATSLHSVAFRLLSA